MTASTTPSTTTTIGSQSDISIKAVAPGVTPFIASVQFTGQSLTHLKSAQFTLSVKPGTVSQPVNVTWDSVALLNRNYLQNSTLSLPVFGLYAAYDNPTSINLTFDDGSSQTFQQVISTTPYVDPAGIYTSPVINKARSAGDGLGFSFFYMKSQLGSPVVVDTDGQVRWVVPGIPNAQATIFVDGHFVVGSLTSTATTFLDMDGATSPLPADLPQSSLSSYTHNIDPGPNGLLAEFNGTDNEGDSFDDLVAEIKPNTTDPPIKTFDMGDILSSFMQSNGDDPSQFVRPGVDWFHLNASTYDPSDQTVIISSRENFLIKVDYVTGNIVWLFGDPTKYWYTFPSLRSKAILLTSGDYPVGQHAVSLTSDGKLMVFNDGLGSLNQPPGASAGINRSYSKVSAYSIDVAARTATEVLSFDDGQSIFSPICGSSYQSGSGGYIVDFATASNFTQARLVGLNAKLAVAFDFQYVSPSFCATAWNARPIHLEGLTIRK